jgi:hypothetical protein
MNPSLSRLIAAFGIAVALVACSTDSALQPNGSPLAGLNRSEAGDTSNTTHSPTGMGPGFFRGTVLGPSQPGAGNDSLNTAPRIANVVVTIYEMTMTGADSGAAGTPKGSVTTGADGKFTLPTLPAGDYVVTFVPPANSGYHGSYAFGPLRANSSDYPWWVVLAKK